MSQPPDATPTTAAAKIAKSSVGDASALKVHVHTDDPGAALSLGTAGGTIDGIEIFSACGMMTSCIDFQ